jgi:hypothetical protein
VIHDIEHRQIDKGKGIGALYNEAVDGWLLADTH